jgi:hypothetical protein
MCSVFVVVVVVVVDAQGAGMLSIEVHTASMLGARPAGSSTSIILVGHACVDGQ